MYCSLGPKESPPKKTNSIFNSVFKHIHISTVITVFYTFASDCFSEPVVVVCAVPNLTLSTREYISSPKKKKKKETDGYRKSRRFCFTDWLLHIVWCSDRSCCEKQPIKNIFELRDVTSTLSLLQPETLVSEISRTDFKPRPCSVRP